MLSNVKAKVHRFLSYTELKQSLPKREALVWCKSKSVIGWCFLCGFRYRCCCMRSAILRTFSRNILNWTQRAKKTCGTCHFDGVGFDRPYALQWGREGEDSTRQDSTRQTWVLFAGEKSTLHWCIIIKSFSTTSNHIDFVHSNMSLTYSFKSANGTSVVSVIESIHLAEAHLLLFFFPSTIFSIRIFSKELGLYIMDPK